MKDIVSLKTILVAASGGTASDGAVEIGCRLARHFEAHLEVLHIRIDPRQVFAGTAGEGFAMPRPGQTIDEFAVDIATLAIKTKAAFEAATVRHGIPLAAAPPGNAGSASATWHEEVGYVPALVARCARFFDFVVLGRSERVIWHPHSDTIEQTLNHCGRPVLLAPPKAPAVLGQTVAIAWNDSLQSLRALVGALPLLATARTVMVITVGNEHESGTRSLLEYLAWHGVVRTHRHVSSSAGGRRGDQLLAAARDAEADLLVMGGYGHTPWREYLLGGATREIVGTSLIPVLLAH
jgi:nucleotide-binding universal stress UspA family protein